MSRTVSLQIFPGYKLRKLGATLKFAAPGKLLGEGIFLQSVGGSFEYPPVSIGLSADLTAGPKVPILGISLVEADGELALGFRALAGAAVRRGTLLRAGHQGQDGGPDGGREGRLAVDGVKGSGSLQGSLVDQQGFYVIKSDLNAWFTRAYAMGVVSSELTVHTFIHDLVLSGNGEITLDGLGRASTAPAISPSGSSSAGTSSSRTCSGASVTSRPSRPASRRTQGRPVRPPPSPPAPAAPCSSPTARNAPPHATLVAPDGTRIDTSADESPIQQAGLLASLIATPTTRTSWWPIRRRAPGTWRATRSRRPPSRRRYPRSPSTPR